MVWLLIPYIAHADLAVVILLPQSSRVARSVAVPPPCQALFGTIVFEALCLENVEVLTVCCSGVWQHWLWGLSLLENTLPLKKSLK